MKEELIEIKPITYLDTKAWLPGSKSYSNRALIIGALIPEETVLLNMDYNQDVTNLRRALEICGVRYGSQGHNLTTSGGLDSLSAPRENISLGDSGTGARFMTGFACLLPGRTTITGSARLCERPFRPLVDALTQLGAEIEYLKEKERLPLMVKGGSLKGGTCRIKGDISSQFISSILLVAPFAQEKITIEIIGAQTSKSYIDITVDVMKSFGVQVINDGYRQFSVPHGQKYRASSFFCESDASSSSYFMGLAAIMGGKIRILNINPHSVQGDIKFCDVLKKMGCSINKGEDWIEVQGPNQLEAIEIDMNSMPDTVQTLAVVAAFARGTTRITNIANLRLKETDRIDALTQELQRIGVEVRELDDGLYIKGGQPRAATIKTYNDHRMAMAFALIGAKVEGIKIENPDVVAKSFPGYWHHIARFGMCEERKSDGVE